MQQFQAEDEVSCRLKLAHSQCGGSRCWREHMSTLGHSRPNHRGSKSTDVRYAPKATVSRQNAIRRYVLLPDLAAGS